MFFESATRLVETLEDCLGVFGDCSMSISRELTKTFEETKRGTISELIAYYSANEPKGEVTVLLDNAHPPVAGVLDLDAAIAENLKFMSVKDAAETVAKETGLSKRQVYQRALELQAADG